MVAVNPSRLALQSGDGSLQSRDGRQQVTDFRVLVVNRRLLRIILDLARAGKSAAQLDSFIDALTKQIRIARGVV